MPGARRQPATRRPIRRDLAGRGVGGIFNNGRTDIFGSGAAVNLFNNPLPVISPKHGPARKFVASSSQYARITPRAGTVNLAGDFAVVVAFTADTITNSRIIHFSDPANSLNLQVLFLSNRLSLAVGAGSSEYAKAHSIVNLDSGTPYVMVAGRSAADGYFMYLDGAAQNVGGTGGIANNVASTDIQIARRGDAASYFNGQVALFAYINGPVDARALSLNPWQIFEDEGDEDLFAASARPPADTALAGAIASPVAASGSLATAIRLAGATAARRANAGALSTVISFTGVATVSASAAGTLTGAAPALAAAAVSSTSLAGALSTSILLAGAATARVAATAALADNGAALSAVAVMRAAASGELYTAIPLSGAASCTVMATGQIAGAGVTLAGAAAAGATTIGSLSTSISLAGTSATRSSAAGALLTVLVLAGQVRASVAGAGDLSVGTKFARAPAGSGYAPRRTEYETRPEQGGGQVRPGQAGGVRPPAIEKAYR